MFAFKTIVWGTFFLLASLILGPWIAVQFDSSFPTLDFGAIRYFGIIFLMSGVPLSLYCAALLFFPRRNNKPKPYDMEEKFVIAGPYEYVRNPFLLGIVIALVGETLLMSNLAMVAYTVLLTWCIHFFVVFFEEPALSDRYGEEYSRYRKSVPRWLPKFRRYRE